MEVMTAETVMPDCIQEEVLTYSSGWLIRQVKVDPMIYSCSRCEELLVHVNHADHSYAAAIGDSSTFLKRKRYTFEANLIPGYHHKVGGQVIRGTESDLERGQPLQDSEAASGRLRGILHPYCSSPRTCLQSARKNCKEIHYVPNWSRTEACKQKNPRRPHQCKEEIEIIHKLS